MQLVDARVTHYRSIIDSGSVEFDPRITGIVGAPGSGKTSFLRMLAGVSDREGFGEADLPRNSDMAAKFRCGKVHAGEIAQLGATFAVEDDDRPRLPPEYRGARRIEVRRTLAGGIALSVDGEALPNADIRREVDAMIGGAGKVARMVRSLECADPDEAAILERSVGEAVSSFGEADFYDSRGAALAMQTLRSAAQSAGAGGGARARIEAELDRIESIGGEMARKIRASPRSAVYRAIPKPLYCGGVFELEDETDLDGFIADPFGSKTFAAVAQICGLTPAGVARARSADPARRDGYLSTRSSILTSLLGRFWPQESHAFRLAIDGSRLRLSVTDRTTGASTPPSERSDGFRWQMAFFLGLLALLARAQGRSIILLDNPATELHERGKGDVLRLMQDAAGSDRIQVVYSTHERALVDPWRADRIRVADLTPDGTKIRTVQAASAGGAIEDVMRSIGSPARYSLFGAPRTVSLEGISDVYTVSAVNEYVAGTDPGASLDRDVYSINSIGGATRAGHALSMYKNMGLDFVIVVGGGREGEEAAARVGREEFERHFVEIRAAEKGGGAGIEDLVDRNLYYEAFKVTYGGMLDRMPTIGEIDPVGERKRSDNYRAWFKETDEEYSRTLVAQRMFGVVINGDGSARGGPDRARALERTGKAFAGLFAAIKAKYGSAAEGDAAQGPPNAG